MGQQACIYTSTAHTHHRTLHTHTTTAKARASTSKMILKSMWSLYKEPKYLHQQECQWRRTRARGRAGARSISSHTVCYCCVSTERCATRMTEENCELCVSSARVTKSTVWNMFLLMLYAVAGAAHFHQSSAPLTHSLSLSLCWTQIHTLAHTTRVDSPSPQWFVRFSRSVKLLCIIFPVLLQSVCSTYTLWCYWHLFTLRQHKYTLFFPDDSTRQSSSVWVSFLMAFKCVLFLKQWQFIHFTLNPHSVSLMIFSLSPRSSRLFFVLTKGWDSFQHLFSNFHLNIYVHFINIHHVIARCVCVCVRDAIANCINNKICMHSVRFELSVIIDYY